MNLCLIKQTAYAGSESYPVSKVSKFDPNDPFCEDGFNSSPLSTQQLRLVQEFSGPLSTPASFDNQPSRYAPYRPGVGGTLADDVVSSNEPAGEAIGAVSGSGNSLLSKAARAVGLCDWRQNHKSPSAFQAYLNGQCAPGQGKNPASQNYCYRAVKHALGAAGAKHGALTSGSAIQAHTRGDLKRAGLKQVSANIASAPNGAVLVYSGGAHGHIEIKTCDSNGVCKYCSDYCSARPSRRALAAVYTL